MAKHNAALLIVFALMASGCATSTDNAAPPSQIATEFVIGNLEFDGCRGSSTAFNYPPLIDPGEYPKAWGERDFINVGSGYFFELFKCERIHVGPFERGPIHYMMESHDKMPFPPSRCRENATGNLYIMHNFLIDDQELADYLANELGMPAHFGELDVMETPNPVGLDMTWRWTFPGGQTSTISTSAQGGMIGPITDTNDQTFWFNDTVLGVFDQTAVLNVQLLSAQQPAFGILYPPMLYAENGMTPYAARGGIFEGGSISRPLKLFSDHLCTSYRS